MGVRKAGCIEHSLPALALLCMGKKDTVFFPKAPDLNTILKLCLLLHWFLFRPYPVLALPRYQNLTQCNQIPAGFTLPCALRQIRLTLQLRLGLHC